MRSILVVAIALVLVSAFPSEAHACPMCFDSSAENRMAFLMTAIALTVLPLGMVSGIGVWLRKKFRDGEVDEGEGDPLA